MAMPIISHPYRSTYLSYLRCAGQLLPSRRLAFENTLLRQELDMLRETLAEIEERLPTQKVVVLRNISKAEAKEEIGRLFKTGRTLYYSDIAEELGLGLELVVDICNGLIADGEVGIEEQTGANALQAR